MSGPLHPGASGSSQKKAGREPLAPSTLRGMKKVVTNFGESRKAALLPGNNRILCQEIRENRTLHEVLPGRRAGGRNRQR